MKLSQLQEIAKTLTQSPDFDPRSAGPEQLRALGLDPANFYQELEMSSPLADTHRDISWSNAQVQLHSHTFYELLYCCNSCGAQYLVGSERYRLEQGDVVIVPPGISHRPLLPEHMDEPYERYVLWLSPEFVEHIAALSPSAMHSGWPQVSILRTAGTAWEHIGQQFYRGIREASRQQPGWEAAVVGNSITLLTQLLRATGASSTRHRAAEKPDLLDRLTGHIELNYTQRISVQDLSRQFYVSSSTVSHLFTKRLGVSLYRYITQRRLIAAKALIEKGLPLEEVAQQTGFSDYSGFYRAFRQEYGICPRQYRSRQAADAAAR